MGRLNKIFRILLILTLFFQFSLDLTMADWETPQSINSTCGAYNPERLIDDDTATAGYHTRVHHHSVVFDMGQNHYINGTRFYLSSSSYYLSLSGVWVSEDTTFDESERVVADQTCVGGSVGWHELSFNPKYGRYINVSLYRLYGGCTWANHYWYSYWREFDAYVEMFDCCDVNAMYVNVTSPSGSQSKVYTLTYSSSSGTCGTTPEVTETWQVNTNYDFCPEEGTYTAVTIGTCSQGPSSCSIYENETSSSVNLYTVNWDSEQGWCTCKTGNSTNWFPTITDGNNGNCCGDDGSNDMFENGGTSNSACVEGNVVAHNTASSSGRYAVVNGEIYYCGTNSDDRDTTHNFVINLIPGNKVGLCQCQWDGTFSCGGVIGIRGGRIQIV